MRFPYILMEKYKIIRMSRCSVSAAISTMKIAKEQQFIENKGLQVRVEFENKAQVEN